MFHFYENKMLVSEVEKYIIRRLGALAQLGERIVRNDEVVGSIPICSTIFKKHL